MKISYKLEITIWREDNFLQVNTINTFVLQEKLKTALMALVDDLSFSTDNLKTDKMRTFCTQKKTQLKEKNHLADTE